MEAAYDLLLAYPGLGPFLAFQILIDLNYTALLGFSEMEFVVPGPGARSGLRKCFSDPGDYDDADLIRYTTDRQAEEFARRGLDFQDLRDDDRATAVDAVAARRAKQSSRACRNGPTRVAGLGHHQSRRSRRPACHRPATPPSARPALPVDAYPGHGPVRLICATSGSGAGLKVGRPAPRQRVYLRCRDPTVRLSAPSSSVSGAGSATSSAPAGARRGSHGDGLRREASEREPRESWLCLWASCLDRATTIGTGSEEPVSGFAALCARVP